MATQLATDISRPSADHDSRLTRAWNGYNVPVVSGDAFFTERQRLRIDCTSHEEHRTELITLLRDWKLPDNPDTNGDDTTSTFDYEQLRSPANLRIIVAQAKWSGLAPLDAKVTDLLGREEALLPILDKLWLSLTRKEGHCDRQVAPRILQLECELRVRFIQARSASLLPTLPASLRAEHEYWTSCSRAAAEIRKDIANQAGQTAITPEELTSQVSIYDKTVYLYTPSIGRGAVFYTRSELTLTYEGSKFDTIQGTAQKTVKAKIRRTTTVDEDALTLTTFQTEPEWREQGFAGGRTIEWRFFMRKRDARDVGETDRFSYDVRLRMTLGARGEVLLNFELPGRWFEHGEGVPKRLSCWGRIESRKSGVSREPDGAVGFGDVPE